MKRNKSGMTLIETIVAMAIISVIVVIATMSINTIAGVNVRAQDMNVADEALEAMIAEGNYVDPALDVTMTLKVFDPATGQPARDEGNEVIQFEIEGQIQTFIEDNTGRQLELFVKEIPNE